MFLDPICSVILQIVNLVSGIPIIGDIVFSVLSSVYDGIGCPNEEETA